MSLETLTLPSDSLSKRDPAQKRILLTCSLEEKGRHRRSDDSFGEKLRIPLSSQCLELLSIRLYFRSGRELSQVRNIVGSGQGEMR